MSDAAPAFRTRTRVLFASRADLAVVLRRGPKTHWQLVLWDTRRDLFKAGQWMKGLVRLMDLAPRGDKLIYWAAQYHPSAAWQPGGRAHGRTNAFDSATVDHRAVLRRLKKNPKRTLPRYLSQAVKGRAIARPVLGVWTAVSTPPYFSALAIWPTFGHWTGGGFFANDKRIVLYESECGLTPIANTPLPSTMTIASFAAAMSGLQPPPTMAHDPGRVLTEHQVELELALRAGGARYIDWTYIKPDGEILFACDGGIYRHPPILAGPGPDILRSAKKLIDLSANRFEQLRAPNDAMRW